MSALIVVMFDVCSDICDRPPLLIHQNTASRSAACVDNRPWNNGKEVPRWGVAEIQKMSPSTTGRCNKQESGDSQPMKARHGDIAANHTDLLSGCGQPCVFAVQA